MTVDIPMLCREKDCNGELLDLIDEYKENDLIVMVLKCNDCHKEYRVEITMEEL